MTKIDDIMNKKMRYADITFQLHLISNLLVKVFFIIFSIIFLLLIFIYESDEYPSILGILLLISILGMFFLPPIFSYFESRLSRKEKVVYCLLIISEKIEKNESISKYVKYLYNLSEKNIEEYTKEELEECIFKEDIIKESIFWKNIKKFTLSINHAIFYNNIKKLDYGIIKNIAINLYIGNKDPIKLSTDLTNIYTQQIQFQTVFTTIKSKITSLFGPIFIQKAKRFVFWELILIGIFYLVYTYIYEGLETLILSFSTLTAAIIKKI